MRKYVKGGGTSGAIYFFGFIGALVYFFSHATSFGIGVLGFFKAIVWPAFIVYKVLQLFKIG